MSEAFVTRDELKVHLELLETRANRRMDGLERKIDHLAEVVETALATTTTALAANTATTATLSRTLTEALAENRTAMVQTLRDVKTNNLATLLGLGAIVMSVMIAAVSIINTTQGTMTAAVGNVLAAVQAGQATGADARSSRPAPPANAAPPAPGLSPS